MTAMGFARDIAETVLNLIRGYTTRVNSYERAAIAALADALDPASKIKVNRRLEAINRVDRLDGGRETLFYQLESGKPVFPEETALVSLEGIVPFARLRIRSADPCTNLTALVYLFNGNLSSIEFNKNTEHAEAGKICAVEVQLMGPPFNVNYE